MLKGVLQSVTSGIFTGNCRREVHGVLDSKNVGFPGNVMAEDPFSLFVLVGGWAFWIIFFPPYINRKMN